MGLEKMTVKKEYVIKVNGMFLSDVGTSDIAFTGESTDARRFNEKKESLGRLIRNINSMVCLGIDKNQIEIMEIETTEIVKNRIVDIEVIKLPNGYIHGKVIEKEEEQK